MINLSTVTKSIINTAKNRIVTAMGYNVVSATEVAPAGIDCPPIEGQLAVYVETHKRNSPVFVGYINKGLMAEPGERRIFAVDGDGAETVRVWLYGSTVEIGGTGSKGSNANHAVQWEALNTQLATFLANQKIAIAASFSALGGTYPITPFADLDITSAKENDILLP